MLDLVGRSLNAKKIKYEVMDKLFKSSQLYKDKNSNKMVNIYIDIESLIKQLYNSELNSGIQNELHTMMNEDKTFIASEIVNYVGHYRHYFASRYNLPTRIMLFYSYDKFDNALDVFPDYRDHYYNTRLDDNNPTFGLTTQHIKSNIDIATMIIKYIPNVYIYNTGNIEPTLLPGYLMQLDPSTDSYSIIISNQEIFYQDIAVKDRSYLLEMKSDDSKLITGNQIIPTWIEGTKKTMYDYVGMIPEIIPLAQVFIANKELNFKSYKRIGKTVSLTKLKKTIDKGLLEPSMYMSKQIDPEVVLDNMIEAKQLKNVSDKDKEDFINRFHFINHKYMISKYDVQLRNIIGPNQTIDLRDPQGMKDANEELFRANPINLDFVFQGFDLEKFGYRG